MKVHELYARVTHSIIQQLEAGTAPWVKPWKNGRTGSVMPHNGATNRAYNGINMLSSEKQSSSCGQRMKLVMCMVGWFILQIQRRLTLVSYSKFLSHKFTFDSVNRIVSGFEVSTDVQTNKTWQL